MGVRWRRVTARRWIAIVSATTVVCVAAIPAVTRATQAKERPRGVIEDCSTISGFGEALRDYGRSENLIVGPLAIRHAGVMLPFWELGQKLFVEVKGGHRVTLELPRETRREVALGFVPPLDVSQWSVRNGRRVVTFVACQRDERPSSEIPDGWPVTGWVGGLIARSPRCVPLLVWVDDERSPRRAVIPYGVRSCG